MKSNQQEIAKLNEADIVVSCFYSALKSGEHNLKNVPGLLLRIINENMWQKRIMKTGETVEFTRFIDFITTKPLEGLGENLDVIKRLCRDNPKALDAIDRVTVNPKHLHTGNNDSNNVTIRGNTNQYALRRLRKSRPDLHKKVLEGEMSAHKAMIQAGFRKKVCSVAVDVKAAAKFLRDNFTDDEWKKIQDLRG